jgi:hypothetical protein
MNASKLIKRIGSVVVLAAAAVAVAPSADAGTVSGNMTVSATVSTACTLNTAALSFGNYISNQAANVTGNSSATLACVGNNSAAGSLASFSITPQGAPTFTMASVGTPADTLNYTLAVNIDAAGNVNVTPGVAISFPLLAGGDAFAITGTIPGGQAANAHNDYQQIVTEAVSY